MRVLLIGPMDARGSLTPYLEVLRTELEALGCSVDWVGSPGVPFHADRGCFWSAREVNAGVATILEQCRLSDHDVVSIHFGKLEIEQLVPLRWRGLKRPPAAYHVHSLHWDLFETYIDVPGLSSEVARGVAEMDGFLFFGEYARSAWRHRIGEKRNTLSFHPATAKGAGFQRRRSAQSRSHSVRATMCGFASPWKDVDALWSAFERVKTPLEFVIAGPLWDTRLGFREAQFGAVRVTVVPDYLTSRRLFELVAESDFGIFPYVDHPTFQGSGALANYMYLGVPVIAFDTANLAEQIADAGIVVPPHDHVALAAAVDRLAGDRAYRSALALAARARSRLFHPRAHAERALQLYRVLAGGPEGARSAS